MWHIDPLNTFKLNPKTQKAGKKSKTYFLRIKAENSEKQNGGFNIAGNSSGSHLGFETLHSALCLAFSFDTHIENGK